MAEQRTAGQSHKASVNDKKRKQPPHHAARSGESSKRPKFDHRAKQRDARQLSTQTASAAFKNGELDVDNFVKARQYEIQALEESMSRSKKALSRRAFQQVPKDLRRRTASHNAKKVPKRLRGRAQREMSEDKTPTVTARRRKPTRHMRLRLDIAKKLRATGAKKQKTSNKDKSGDTAIDTRAPRVKRATLARPPVPKAKFRKRQVHKTWLPTHLFHAKRAHMSPPSKPLWRFSIPISPTVKSYRPTHRASSERGAVAWDTSYISTIGLEGRTSSLESVLRGLRVGILRDQEEPYVWGKKGTKWRKGLRALETLAYSREAPHIPIAPVTVIWCTSTEEIDSEKAQRSSRKIFIRVHPSAFLQLWEEVLRLSKVAKPAVSVVDLRFEIGCIDVQGPGATEALLGTLWPTTSDAFGDHSMEDGDNKLSVETTWNSLAGLTDPFLLPAGALMGFTVQDPRLHFPPGTIQSIRNEPGLLATAASWPIDEVQGAPLIFDRKSRIAAGAAMSSQKAINRRKALAVPGKYPPPLVRDPKIPVLVFTSPTCKFQSGPRRQSQPSSWTVLLPWKCVQSVWYGIMYYPLSTGQQPRFGGLDEIRQLSFEAGRPWFPADFPGSISGWEWEVEQRAKRHDEWSRHPNGKRINWDKVDLGADKLGEVGSGWACDWGRLLQTQSSLNHVDAAESTNSAAAAPEAPPVEKPEGLIGLSSTQAQQLLMTSSEIPQDMTSALITVRLSLVTRGVPQICARIYRLPSKDLALRRAWLGLQPDHKRKKTPKTAPLRLPKDAPAHVLQQRLAASLLEVPKVGDDNYPRCPGEEDLIGFVTTGNFNLSQGQGTGIGSILLTRVVEDARQDPREGRLCIVRNAGNNAGRLARWEIAG